AGLARQCVIVGQQAVPKLKKFSADGLDVSVVQLGGIDIPVVFNRSVFSRVPAPRQAQMPRASVRTERRTECRELKPSRVEFAGEFTGRVKSSGVAAPERRETEAVVQANRHMRRESLPLAIDIAGPDPAAKTLRTGVACAVQTPRADVRPILQGTFVVTAVPRQPRVKRQFVAIVRPPAVHTQRKRLAMA